MNTLVPIEDVAKHFSVSLSTVRKWARDGVIPENMYVKIGHTQRFDLDRVADALMRYKEKSSPDTYGIDYSNDNFGDVDDDI